MNLFYSLKFFLKTKFTIFSLFIFSVFSIPLISQTVTITAPVASATFCAGTNITVNYTVSANFAAGNVFTTQLSDGSGSFASPTVLGTRTAANGGGSTFVIPYYTNRYGI